MRSKSFREMFRAMDTDNSGSLDKDELKEGLRSIGINLSNGDFNSIWRKVDADGGGDISYKEFAGAFDTDKNIDKHKTEDLGYVTMAAI